VTATNSAGSASENITAFICFLAGAQVAMADGTTKAIETVVAGDSVIGAFGERNTVLGLQKSYLGNSKMCKINGEHDATYNHPHVSVDKKFYAPFPAGVEGKIYGKKFPVIGANGITTMTIDGLKPGRLQRMSTGVELKTLEGSRVVKTLELYTLPYDTRTYHLVTSGSHTYHVNGYAVTGWPSERDFDYDAWVPKTTVEPPRVEPVDPRVAMATALLNRR